MDRITSTSHPQPRARTAARPRSSSGAPAVLIAAFQPEEPLVDLVRELRRRSPQSPVVVVDDGSGVGVGGRYAVILERVRRLGAKVVRHHVARGRGQAVTTGLAHVAAHHPDRAVVWVDADGAPLVADVLTVGAAVDQRPGAREVARGVRAGNSRSGAQGGVWAAPAELVGWLLQVRGSRAGWERRVVRQASGAGVTVRQVPLPPLGRVPGAVRPAVARSPQASSASSTFALAPSRRARA